MQFRALAFTTGILCIASSHSILERPKRSMPFIVTGSKDLKEKMAP